MKLFVFNMVMLGLLMLCLYAIGTILVLGCGYGAVLAYSVGDTPKLIEAIIVGLCTTGTMCIMTITYITVWKGERVEL